MRTITIEQLHEYSRERMAEARKEENNQVAIGMMKELSALQDFIISIIESK